MLMSLSDLLSCDTVLSNLLELLSIGRLPSSLPFDGILSWWHLLGRLAQLSFEHGATNPKVSSPKAWGAFGLSKASLQLCLMACLTRLMA